MRRVSNNGYKKYLKSRPLPSSESSRRMKEESWDRKIGNHPLFNDYINSIMSKKHQHLEEERQSLLNSLKTLRPKTVSILLFTFFKIIKINFLFCLCS